MRGGSQVHADLLRKGKLSQKKKEWKLIWRKRLKICTSGVHQPLVLRSWSILLLACCMQPPPVWWWEWQLGCNCHPRGCKKKGKMRLWKSVGAAYCPFIGNFLLRRNKREVSDKTCSISLHGRWQERQEQALFLEIERCGFAHKKKKKQTPHHVSSFYSYEHHSWREMEQFRKDKHLLRKHIKIAKGLHLMKSVGLLGGMLKGWNWWNKEKERKGKAVTYNLGFDLTVLTCASNFTDFQRLIPCG